MAVEPVLKTHGTFDLFQTLDALSMGGLYKAEYLEGAFHVSPQGDDEHADLATSVIFQLQSAGLVLASSGAGYCPEPYDSEHQPGAAFVPDFYVRHRRPTELDRQFYKRHKGWYPASMLRLAGEVTSPGNHTVDREEKYREYARAGIEVYVLLDRQKNFAVCYSEPDRKTEQYEKYSSVPLGDVLTLPDGWPTLKTAVLN